MIARLPRLLLSWLAAFVFVLGGGVSAHAQSPTPRQKFPGSRAPTNSPALRGASQRSTSASSPRSSPLFSSTGETIQLPFYVVWGDTQSRLSALFVGVGAKVTDKKASGQTEVWTVQGLIAPDLQSSLFTFQQGLLVAMEFDYGQADWDLPKFNDKMGLFRRVLESKCGGPGEMVSRDTAQEPNSTVKQTLMGYQWSRGDTLVQLFYFSAEDTAKAMSFRTISVHYHYKEPSYEPPAMPESPMPEAGGPPDPNSNPLFGGKGAPVGTDASSPSPSPGISPSPGPSPSASPTESASPSPGASVSVSPSPMPTALPKAKSSPGTPENDPLPEH